MSESGISPFPNVIPLIEGSRLNRKNAKRPKNKLLKYLCCCVFCKLDVLAQLSRNIDDLTVRSYYLINLLEHGSRPTVVQLLYCVSLSAFGETSDLCNCACQAISGCMAIRIVRQSVLIARNTGANFISAPEKRPLGLCLDIVSVLKLMGPRLSETQLRVYDEGRRSCAIIGPRPADSTRSVETKQCRLITWPVSWNVKHRSRQTQLR
jgi:hypothetical protein